MHGHYSSFRFLLIFLKLCRCFCHGLKMCMCFWDYPPVIFYQLFPLFQHRQISIRIDTLWVQLILEFSTDHFETIHTCSTWSEDVHVVLGLSSRYFYQLFFYFFIPRHTIVAGYYGFTLDVRVSVRPSIRPYFVSG